MADCNEDVYEWDQVKEDVVKELVVVQKRLDEIWTKCGYDTKGRTVRCRAVTKHIHLLCTEMIKEEEDTQLKHVDCIEKYTQTLKTLCQELVIKFPEDDFSDLPFIQAEAALTDKIHKLNNMKAKKMEKLSVLREKEEKLCQDLGREMKTLDPLVLTDEFFQTYEDYVKSLKQEKIRLGEIFLDTQASIVALVEKLEWLPSLDFEKEVIYGKKSDFILSEDNMKHLESFHNKLLREFEERTNYIAELQEKLTCLWDRLNIGSLDRENFHEENKKCTNATIAAMKKEIGRFEEIKRQNVRKFVENIRGELQDWWDKCFYSEEQRRQFVPFYSDCYTEDLLELHELEVQKLRSFYYNNVAIFDLYAKHEILWERMLSLEEKANDPNRLFVNRGGQLLQEEKERKIIQKDLPKIEAEIMSHVEVYEREYEKAFLVKGIRFSDLIRQQWDNLKANKEKERKARKIARNHQTEMESKLGSKSLTKNQSLKRKNNRCVTPTHSANKNPRVGTSERKPLTCISSANKPKAKEDPGRIRPVKRNILRMSRSVEDLRVHDVFAKPLIKDQFPQGQDISFAASIASYTDFQEQLDQKNLDSLYRSSVIPGKLNTLHHKLTPSKPPRRNVATPKDFIRQKTPSTRTPPVRRVQTIQKLSEKKGMQYFM